MASSQPHYPERTKFNRSASDAMSYEDLLVAQYLEQLRTAEVNTSTRRRLTRPTKPASPYMQKVAHTTEQAAAAAANTHQPSLPKAPGRARLHSASATGRNASRERKRIDVKFVMDTGEKGAGGEEERGRPEKEQAGMEKEEDGRINRAKMRPASAPVYKTKRPWSGKSTTSTATMSLRSHRTKALYRLQPQVIRATVYKNGLHVDGARVTAQSMKSFLEDSTSKLNLQFAARRLYLLDGTEVQFPEEIPKDAEVFISCGEPFKDPSSNVKGDAHKKLNAAWSMNGVILPADTKKKKRSSLSKRMRKMLESKMRRVMIFRNGDGTEVSETTASKDNFDRFLDDCTARLGLTVPARVIYSWTGEEITDFSQVPLLDRCLQTSTTPLYGPVWISKGERFSPKGVKDTSIKFCRGKIRAANVYKTQLDHALAGRTGQVEVIGVLSKTKQELESDLQETKEGIEEFTEAETKLRNVLDEISELVSQEEGIGHSYTLQHIKEFDASHRLVGQQGIRLKVYENGQFDGEETVFFNLKEASKGIGHDNVLLHQRLLDVITRCVHLEKNTPALSTVVTNIFDRDGKEIRDVHSLSNDQEVWISYGEPYRDPNVLCLQLTFDKAQGLSLYQERTALVREPLSSADMEKGDEKPSHWEATIGFPMLYDFEVVTYDLSKDVQDAKQLAVDKHELDSAGHFLQHKDDSSRVLYCEVALQPKKKQSSRDVWPPRSQTWVINKKGQIYCRAMPQLALAVVEKWKVDKTFADEQSPAQGLAVGLEKKQQGNPYQQWVFTDDGLVYSESEPELVLTYVEAKERDDDGVAMAMMMSLNQADSRPSPDDVDPYEADPDFEDESEKVDETKKVERDTFPGQVFAVAVLPRLPAKHKWAKSQRWAVKQESLENLGQWKHTKAQNPQWNKLAYSWPVDAKGEWNEDCDWPMEGYIIPYAPPIGGKSARKQSCELDVNAEGETRQSPIRTVPLRLRVLKNGERDLNRLAFVVGPDLTNMMRDLNRTALNGKRPHHRRARSRSREKNPDGQDEGKKQARRDDLKTLEFQLFLDRCTALLNLPFAGRRLFDRDGVEHHSLDRLGRDQLVYASCGEAWSNPDLSSQEQQRCTLLAALTADVNAAKQYCLLRNPAGVVLEVEGSLAVGSPLVVNRVAITSEERQRLVQGPTPEPEEEEEHEAVGDPYANLSAHERAHIASEQRADGLKWPWERVLNVGLDEVEEVNQSQQMDSREDDPGGYSNQELYRKLRPKPTGKSPRGGSSHLARQRFDFTDGFLAVRSDPRLVVGLEEPEVESSRVVLCRRNQEDATQRWEMDAAGVIHSKSNPDVVLAVQATSNVRLADSGDPTTTSSSSPCGQAVVLQHHRLERYGVANQKWFYEKETGLLDGMAADVSDKEVTAANKANICTFAVCGDTPMEQMGFLVTAVTSADPVIVCAACARSMRASTKLRRLGEPTEFACAVGLTPHRGPKMNGCFQCLNGKLDLSTFEAANSISRYDKELRRLRQMSSARVIAREIATYQPVQTVRIQAYRNGHGRTTDGVLMVGSTVRGFLDQCTYHLQLSSAARRLYTQDGTLILTVSDLIQWNLACYGMAGLDISEPDVDKKEKTGDRRRETSDLHPSSVLRIPVEVWVSCGEQFVRPEHVDYRKRLVLQHREERAGVVLELEKEKHILRQMQGRRAHTMEVPQYVSTLDPDTPVMVEGGWTQPSVGEVRTSLTVHQLENHLQEVKGQQVNQHAVTRSAIDETKKLYSQPNMKRIKAYRNGDPAETFTFAWGSSLADLLRDSTMRLNLRRAAVMLYTTEGQKVASFEDVGRDQLLCVSRGDCFKGSKGSRSQVELKANWVRARKKDGPQATEIIVTPNRHPAVTVDPFGPPSLALPAAADSD